MSRKALILTWELYQDHEVIYPYYRLTEDGFDVTLMSNKIGRIFGLLGAHMDSTALLSELSDSKKTSDYFKFDLLVIPGGVKALEKLRQEKQVLEFIHKWNSLAKPIACICHGAQLLISSNVVKGRKVSGYYSIKDDINNAGAEFVDQPFVLDDNLVTSPHYMHMGVWMKAGIDLVIAR